MITLYSYRVVWWRVEEGHRIYKENLKLNKTIDNEILYSLPAICQIPTAPILIL